MSLLTIKQCHYKTIGINVRLRKVTNLDNLNIKINILALCRHDGNHKINRFIE